MMDLPKERPGRNRFQRFAGRLLFVFCLIGPSPARAQSLDSLWERWKDLPLDTMEQRARTIADLRMRAQYMAYIGEQYIFLGRGEDCMRLALDLLSVCEQLGNDSLTANAHTLIGSVFGMNNDVNTALEHFNRAMVLAEQTQDSTMRAFLCKEIGLLYRRSGDHQTNLRYLRRSLAFGPSAPGRSRIMGSMSKSYVELGLLDSALYCAREADIERVPDNDPYGYSSSQFGLANVYAARKETDLAETYYKRAVAAADSFHMPDPMVDATGGYARLLIEQGKSAEGLVMAQRGYRAALGMGTANAMVRAAGALARAFEANHSSDSALAYLKIRDAFRDSVMSAENRGRLQSQFFNQELKDREDAKLRAEEVAERSRNIQYGIIALITITLIIFLLLLSRSSIVGARAIKNLSLVALLLVFEFLNLLLHPLLDRITNHSPILMILAMVCIAGLLIPLHHRMEHFITNMLVRKNNRVRLEAAKRTIEELEARPDDTNAA